MVPQLTSKVTFTPLLKPWGCSEVRHDKPSQQAHMLGLEILLGWNITCEGRMPRNWY